MKRTQSDIIIIGAGIMGSSAAFFLQQRGRSVCLLEKDKVGQHASGTNFGNVRRQGRPLYQLPLANRASRIWRNANSLLGTDVEYLQNGHMRVCFKDRPDAIGLFEEYAKEAKHHELDLEVLSENMLHQRFPFLGDEVLAGSYAAMDGHANPRLVSPAFARAAQKLGAQVFENTCITGVEKINEDFVVVSNDGHEFRAPILLIAAGAWGGTLSAQFNEPAPLTSFGPTMTVTEPLPYSLKPTVGVFTSSVTETVYFRQITRGNIVIGGSNRSPGYPLTGHTHVRPENTLSQWHHIQRLCPQLAQLNIIRVWSGTEGYLPDYQPIMCASKKESGLFYAFGFSGSGFQIGPAVGDVMAELIDTGKTDIDLSHYQMNRFGA